MSENPAHSDVRVVFLHGALGAPGDWTALAADLKLPPARCGYVNLYQRAALSGEKNLRDLLLAAVPGKGPVVLVGYSMGGRLALQTMLASPDDFAGAVVVSTHPGLKDEVAEARRLKQDREWARRARALPWEDFLSRWSLRPIFSFGRDVREWRKDLADTWRDGRTALETRRTFVADALDTWSLGVQGDLRGPLSRLEKPIFWLAGAQDAKFAKLAKEAADLHSLAEHQVIADTGHRVPWESPEAFARAVNKFLERF